MTNQPRTNTFKNDVEIVSKNTVFQGYFRMDEYRLHFKLFEGGWSDEVIREVFKRGQVAAVLPYDPLLKKVVLLEQFRIGAIKDERSPWLLEIVAGVLQEEETPIELAHRESREEAGLEVQELIPIYNYWVSPGGCSERVALFCAKVDASKAGGVHGLADENEDIKVHVFDVEEAFEMVRNGMINNALGIISLQWLELNQDKIFRS